MWNSPAAACSARATGSCSASGATCRPRWNKTPPPLRTWSSSATAATAPCRFWTSRAVNARIEPGAILRDRVEIGDRAVIMMGAILNIGAVVGEDTMIDMGAVLGGRATVGKRCHVGAGAVLAGVVEPASATPVVVEDDVLIGANAVVLEGVHIGKGAVIAAGCVVVSDVPENAVVAGVPGRVIKMKDEKTEKKTALVDALRALD